MYPFFETIAIDDGHGLNLSSHQERINQTFSKYYIGFQPHDLATILEKGTKIKSGKLKFYYNHQRFTYEFQAYAKKLWRKFYLYEINYLIYNYKFSDRLLFNWTKMKHAYDEEIIFTKNGFITDCTYANIAFMKEDFYITPNHALLQGTMRKKLISEGKLMAKDIHKNELSEFIGFKLINSLNDLKHSHFYPIESIQK